MKTKQTVLLPISEQYHVETHVTCGDCIHKYRRKIGKTAFYKCKFKPRGWGYDIRLTHIACKNFRLNTEIIKQRKEAVNMHIPLKIKGTDLLL